MYERLCRLLHPENHGALPNSPMDDHTKTLLARVHRVKEYRDHKYSETPSGKPAQRPAGHSGFSASHHMASNPCAVRGPRSPSLQDFKDVRRQARCRRIHLTPERISGRECEKKMALRSWTVKVPGKMMISNITMSACHKEKPGGLDT